MKARIYKISNCKDKKYYIGATIQTLEDRFEHHKNDNTFSRKSKFYRHYDEIGWESAKIELIKEVEVEEGQEMLIYETQYILKYIKDPDLLNSRISFDFHHLFLVKREFVRIPGELILILNRAYRECGKNKEKQCNKDSIFIRPRYKKVEKIKDCIVKQYELKIKALVEMLGNFEDLSE
jgi:hypothetical protein